MASTHNPTKPVATIEKDGDDLMHESEERMAGLAYQHASLSSPRAIRVLVLLPGQPNGRLECELDVIELDSPESDGAYTAISYTWNASKYDRLFVKSERISPAAEIHGRLAIRHPVYCGDKRLLVSTNLYNLLRRMRHGVDGISLWIDAICINQEDLDERASQVLLMQDIYSRADSVLLWLGEEDDRTKMAFALASKLVHHPNADPATGFTSAIPMSGLDLVNGTGPARMGLPKIDAPDWQALFGLFERPVFRRSWIIQEMALARTPLMILCGDSTILFAELLGATAFLRSCGWLELLQAKPQPGGDSAAFNAQSYAEDIMRIRSEVRYAKQRPHIALVMKFEATDPRDKIYALLGLMQLSAMPPESQALLRPNYRRSVDDIYRDATVALIGAERSLAILSLAGLAPAGDRPNLPSWVPDYSTARDSHGAPLVGTHPHLCPYHAGGPLPPASSPAAPGRPRALALRAFRVGTVSAAAQQDPARLENAQLVEWIGLMKQLPTTYAATGEEVEDALWRTLVGNRNVERGGGAEFTDAPRVRDAFNEFIRVKLLGVMAAGGSAAGPDVTEGMVLGYEAFTKAWMFNMIGRRFFLTRNGLMGMGPALRVGDLVYVVAGAPVPLVVRQEGSVRRLVGDCYVHGIMNGDCLRWSSFAWHDLILE